ncbi:MAG: hypothetical protein AB1455_11730 [Pseudomonadota bacterium]
MKPGTACLAASALLLSAAAQVALAAPRQVQLVCEAVYLPARSTWTRSVDIRYDDRRIREVAIDGQPVYTFAVRGTVILTSQDNERIQIDTAGGSWTSDFRGLASAQGRCERVD